MTSAIGDAVTSVTDCHGHLFATSSMIRHHALGMNDLRALTDTIRQRAAGRDRPLIVALDGRSGSGKSTLAVALAAELNAVVVASDDFWPGGTDAEWAAR